MNYSKDKCSRDSRYSTDTTNENDPSTDDWDDDHDIIGISDSRRNGRYLL